uniref:peptidyl-tRNA hydrolase n=1 Tax=Nyssomyia neivai TaxID=330878 RepID=A0A1L8E1C3_9DIPT
MLWRLFRRGDVPKTLKMVLVVRGDLRLSKGKTSSQCAHAAVTCYEKSLTTRKHLLALWKLQGQPKVVLKVPDCQELIKLHDTARAQGIIATIIHDAGKTEVPSGTMTVLGLGPDCSDKLKDIVGKLKVL